MIDLYTCRTANGYRASIALEECGLPYVAHALDLAKDEHRSSAFLAINPLGRVPAIVDDDAPDHAKLIAKFFADIRNYLAAIEGQLQRTTFLAADEISFADIMAIPTIVRNLPAMRVDLEPFPAVRRWGELVGSRPAVVRGLAVP